MYNDRIEDNIRTFFATRPSGRVFAYLFGSVAQGIQARQRCRSRPIIQQEPPATLEGLGLDLAGALERRLGRELAG